MGALGAEATGAILGSGDTSRGLGATPSTPRVPLVVDELGKTPLGFPRPKGMEDTTPRGSWVGAGDPRTPSSALPSQVAQRRGPFPERPV